MEASWGTLLPDHHTTKHKRAISERSFQFKKRPRLFSSFRGFLHRGTRSTSSIRTSNSANELALCSSVPPTPRPPRSKSIDGGQKPTKWTQRGATPGLDDYLTLEQLEGVWKTQDSYLGDHDVPQRATSYKYVEPVEAPTIARHQHHVAPMKRPLRTPRHTNIASQPIRVDYPSRPLPTSPSSSTSQRGPQTPKHKVARPSSPASPQSGKHQASSPPSPPRAALIFDDGLADGQLSPVRVPSPLRPRKRSNKTDQPQCKTVRAPSPLRPIVPPKEDAPLMQHGQEPEGPLSGWERPMLPRNTATSRSPPVSRPQPSNASRRHAPSKADVRNIVVSGIVHPALRPSPYFENCATPIAV